MQSVFDSREFTIIERYAHESSQQYHLSNPYWKTFDPYVLPLLEKVCPTPCPGFLVCLLGVGCLREGDGNVDVLYAVCLYACREKT